MNLFQQLYNTADSLIGAFKGDPEVVHFGVMQARTIALFYFLLAFSHCIAAVLRGSGNGIDSDDRHALRLVSVPGKLYYRRCSFYSRYPRGIPGVPADLEHQFRHFPVSVFAGEMGVWV